MCTAEERLDSWELLVMWAKVACIALAVAALLGSADDAAAAAAIQLALTMGSRRTSFHSAPE